MTCSLTLIIILNVHYFFKRFVNTFCSKLVMCTTISSLILPYRQKQQEKEFIEKLLVDNFTCSICLDIFKKPVGLKCGHMFCSRCLFTWLLDHQTCPMCRFVIPSRTTVKCEFIEKLIAEMKSTCAANVKRSPSVNISSYDVGTWKNVHPNSKKNINQRPPWR